MCCPGSTYSWGRLQVEAFFDGRPEARDGPRPDPPGPRAADGVEPGRDRHRRGRDRAERRARDGLRARSRTPVTGRSRWARTSTSSRSTARCGSIAHGRSGCTSTSPRAPRSGSSPARSARSTLVAFGGTREVHGLNRLTGGRRPATALAAALARAERAGFLTAGGVTMGRRISRRHYAELFGPTTGDRSPARRYRSVGRGRARPPRARRRVRVRRRQDAARRPGHERRASPQPTARSTS